MTQVDVHIVNAFVDDGNGGNPAGVVIDADNFSNAAKLFIASQVGLSETAFVSRSDKADFKLDFYTPSRQIAHCGHATVATFSFLKQLQKVPSLQTSKETMDGVRRILIQGEEIYLEQSSPQYTSASDSRNEIANSLGLELSDLSGVYAPYAVNTGNTWIAIPVKESSALQKINLDLQSIHAISEKYDSIGFYVFSPQSNRPDRDATIRMFAPRYGITEESATGTAASTLACYFYDIMKVRQQKFQFEQGHYMMPSSPSLLSVELEINQGKIDRVFVGGKAAFKQTRSIELNP